MHGSSSPASHFTSKDLAQGKMGWAGDIRRGAGGAGEQGYTDAATDVFKCNADRDSRFTSFARARRAEAAGRTG